MSRPERRSQTKPEQVVTWAVLVIVLGCVAALLVALTARAVVAVWP